MAACARCNAAIEGSAILYAGDGSTICAACNDRADLASTTAAARPPWMAMAIAGLAVGAVPFVVHVSSSSVSSVNGHVTSFVYRDWIAVACGVVAVLLGLAALWMGRVSLVRVQAIAAGLGVALFGGYQIARGFGVFAMPDGGADSSSSVSLTLPPEPTAPTPAAPTPAVPAECNDQQSCFDRGRELEKANDPTAGHVYERACGFQSPAGCFNAGIFADHRTPPDVVASAGWYQKGCDLKDADACTNLGVATLHGQGVAKDVDRAASIYEMSCELGDDDGCANRAGMAGEKLGPPLPGKRIVELYIRACDLGDADKADAVACDRAGARLVTGNGVPVDKKTGIHYLEVACDRSAKACHDLGLSAKAGDGIKKDLVRARELFRKSCDAGNLDACNDIASMENNGEGGAKDVADATTLFKRACDGGVDTACKNLAIVTGK